MTDRLRAGIVGAGFMGEVHARAVRAAGGVVARVAASTPERSAAAAARLGAEGAAESAEALLTADDVDVVHVCTPNALHVPVAEGALAAGKPVVCEKPLATTVEDARRLTTTAEQAALVATVPFVYRFYATVREARARIAAGEAGPLRLLHGTYLQDWLSKREDSNWRVDPQLGGASRAFGDIGVHWCDLMEFVTGHRITRLIARMVTAFDRRPAESGSAAVGTEDAATVLFETDQGACGAVVISQVSPGRKNRLWFSFDGAERLVSFDQESPDSLWIGGRAYNQILMRGAEGTSEAAARYSILPAGHPQGYQDSFNAFVADAYAAVMGAAARRAPDLRRRPASGDTDPGGRRLRHQPGLGGGTRMKLGFLTACLPHRAWRRSPAGRPTTGSKPWRSRPGPTWATGRSPPPTSMWPTWTRPAPTASASCSTGTAWSCRRWPSTTTTSTPTRPSVRPSTTTCWPASTPPPCSAARRSGPSSAATRPGAWPTTSVRPSRSSSRWSTGPGERGVKLIIENCVMEGWHPDGYPGNLAYSPELWEWMFSLGLYLNYDPSHLVWMGIDPVTALRPYVDRIPHAQAKDIQLFGERRNRYGWPGKAVQRPDPWDVGWWRYRVPGLGQVDWLRVVDTLYEGGFDGVLSVEHEDPVWGGDEDKVKTGLDIAHYTLRPLLVA